MGLFFPELFELQQLSGDSGLFTLEGAWTQVLEETLHVPAPLRALLLYERNVQGDKLLQH